MVLSNWLGWGLQIWHCIFIYIGLEIVYNLYSIAEAIKQNNT